MKHHLMFSHRLALDFALQEVDSFSFRLWQLYSDRLLNNSCLIISN